MQIDLSTLIAFLIPCTLGLVWLVRLEGRVNTAEALYAEIKADLSELKIDVKALLKR